MELYLCLLVNVYELICDVELEKLEVGKWGQLLTGGTFEEKIKTYFNL